MKDGFMNSRERVLTVFNHQIPDRVPCWCGASVEFWEKAKKTLNLDDEALRRRFGDDFRRVGSKYIGPALNLSDGCTWRTPFGIERHGHGYGQPTSHPLAEATVKQVHDYTWPLPKWWDISHISKEAQYYKREYAILGGEWSPFWHDAIDLFGMENFLIKMYTEPEVIDAALKHIIDFYVSLSQQTFDAAASSIDIFFIGNDFGSQCGPLVGEELFSRFIMPHLKRLIDLGHSYNLKVMLHCCGGIVPLIPQMIEAGLDGLHAVQPSCVGMDLKTLKSSFGNKIVFNGAIDSHHVLIEGSPETVRQKTKEVLDIMKPGGGYIAGASHDTILEETPVENVLAMFDAIKEFGAY